MTGRSRTVLQQGAVFLGFALLAVAMTWPLATHLGTHVVDAKWHYDSMVNIHVLGSRMHYAQGRAEGLKSIYDNYFCAPTPYSIANNESHFGLVLLYAPFYLASNDPLLSYNLLLLLCLALSGYSMYLLARDLTGHELAAGLAGVAYAFCPYIFFEMGRIQLVAAQWIPLFAMYLHRAARTQSLSSLVLVALLFAMQVGSCLYYAMFMVVYAACVGLYWLFEHRAFTRKFALGFAAAAIIAGSLVAFMTYPYVAARKDYTLTRSEELTDSYSGRLTDLVSVYPMNKAWKPLHNKAEGPTEPIAFPGFVIGLLALLALILPAASAVRAATPEARKRFWLGLPLALGVLPLAAYASLLAHTFLAGTVIVAIAVVAWRLVMPARFLPSLVVVHGLFLLAGLVLFLGPLPFEHGGQPVRGLYYYLYKHVFGFDGIRYVSRFTVFNMLALCTLGAIGAAALLGQNKKRSVPLFVIALALMLFELRNAPVALAKLPDVKTVSPVYEWLRKHPGPEPIATIPAYPMGFYGARNDYLALFHERRTIDGKSSWMPPITHTFIYEARRMPRRTMTRLLQSLGAKYLVLHTAELDRVRALRVREWLDRRPDDFQRRFSAGSDFVYEVMKPKDHSVSLLSTPPLPPNLQRISPSQLFATASLSPETAPLAFDGQPKTRWTTRRGQYQGDWFDIELKQPQKIQALELSDFGEVFEAPSAITITVRDQAGVAQTVLSRSELRFYYDQVYHPRSFVMRVVLPEPVVAAGIRIQLNDGVAGRRWSMHEVAIYGLE
jgi:hypothetical protein